MDEFLWCDHSNESSLAEQLRDAIYYLDCSRGNFGICCEFFLWPLLGVKRLSSDIFKRNKMLFPLKAQKDKCCFVVAQRVLPSISLLLADFPLNNQTAH